MKNLPIGKQIQKFAWASVYQHLLLGSQEHRGLSVLSLTCHSNKEFNYELKIKAGPEKSPFFSRSNFWTRPSQQKCPTLTPYCLGRTITLHSGKWSILMDAYIVITHFWFRPGTTRNFIRPGTRFKLVLYISLLRRQSIISFLCSRSRSRSTSHHAGRHLRLWWWWRHHYSYDAKTSIAAIVAHQDTDTSDVDKPLRLAPAISICILDQMCWHTGGMIYLQSSTL